MTEYYSVTQHGIKLDFYPDDVKYFIVGRCFNGSRHYSEDMTYENALATMPKYIGIVEHFGGGTVDLMTEGQVLRHKIVHS